MKDVADYLAKPFFEVMHMPIVEVLPVVLIMQRKTKLTELLTPKPK